MTVTTSSHRPRRRLALLAASGIVAGSALTAAGIVAAPMAAHAVPTCSADDPTVSTFTANQSGSFAVPTGITRVHVAAAGGQGRLASQGSGAGGSGALVTSDVSVTPGHTLTVNVGQAGAQPAGGDSGGSPSGGAGGTYSSVTSGGGGGGSFITDGPTLLIAAGGGGGSGYGFPDNSGGNATDSTQSQPPGAVTDGDDGGSPTEPGDGGDGGGGGGGTTMPGAGGSSPSGWGDPGSPGAGEVGGASGSAGGGGGGGYAGGGGGGLGGFTGGGGAGSSYGIDAYTIAPSSGDGSVAISYEVPAVTSGSSTTFTAQEAGSFTICTTGVPTATIGEAGSLPNGVSFVDNGDGTGTLSGVPASGTENTYPLTFTASNGNGSDAVQDFTLTVAKALPSVAVAAAPTGSTFGQQVIFTATIDGVPAGSSPTGTVDFEDNAAPLCTGSPVSTTAQVSTATCTTSALTAGSHTISADYNGDGDYSSAPGELDNFTVAQASPNLDIASSLTPSTYGQAETATASVTPSDVAGSVQFSVDGDNLGSPVTVDAGSAQSPTLTDSGAVLAPTDNTVEAVFTPTDTTDYTSPNKSYDQVVDKAMTSTAVSVGTTTITAGVAPVAPGAGSPTGSVTFSVDGSAVGSAPVNGGTATLTYAVPAGHAHNIAASYGGDSDFNPSSASTSRSDPSIKATVTSAHPKSKYGWYRSPVTVHFTCTTHGAPLSGGCPSKVTLTKNGGGQSVSRTIIATDGGTATVVVKPINIDRRAPHVSIAGVKNGAFYDGGAPTPHCVGVDTMSGIASCRVSISRHGSTTTVRATATTEAGRSASTVLRYRTLNPFIVKATYRHGAFITKVGHDYLVEAIANKHPLYLYAAPANTSHPHNQPAGEGPRLSKVGKNLWSVQISITKAMDTRYHLWNVGVRFGGMVHVIEIRLVG
jgi:hypothetical protein